MVGEKRDGRWIRDISSIAKVSVLHTLISKFNAILVKSSEGYFFGIG